MSRLLLFSILCLFIGQSAFSDDTEINAAQDRLNETSEQLFNRHDAEGFSKLYAEDADVHHHGREPYANRQEIADVWAKIFKNDPDVRMEIMNVKRRILTPEIVVESGTVLLNSSAGRSEGKYMAVTQLRDGKWLTVFERSWPTK